MSSELDRQGLIDIFVIEASEALGVLTKAFYPPDRTTPIPTPTQLQEQYVWAHKIRGASALYGYDVTLAKGVGDLAWDRDVA